MVGSKRRVVALAAGLAALAALAPVAPARAAITIGSDLTAAPAAGLSCPTETCTYTQRALPGATLASPVNGTITTWRQKGSAGPMQIRLRILRPFANDVFNFAGSSGFESVFAGDHVNTFAASVPISAGDRIGVDQYGGGLGNIVAALHGSAEIFYWAPVRPDGTTAAPDNDTGFFELLLNADIEPSNAVAVGKMKPTKKGRTFLDLTVPNAGTLVLDGRPKGGKPKKKKKKKGKKGKPGPQALVRNQTVRVPSAGPLTLVLQPTKAAKRLLKKKGKANGKADLTFTPDQGTAATQRITVRFKGKKKKKRKKRRK